MVQLFSELSDAHDNLSKVAKSISKLGKIASPEQFGFILKLTIQPLIQLKVPPHLCSPGDLRFSSERLTQEEYFEEMCINEILPEPYHNKFSKFLIKHATHCQAAATHYLLRKCMFDSKVSQSTLTKEFAVVEKKLHLAVSGRKYDPGKKIPKPKTHVKSSTQTKKSAKPDEPKMDEKTKIPEDKQASPEDPDQPQFNDVNDEDDDDSLPDPFAPKEKKAKMSGTKEDQGAEDTHAEMDTMSELISRDDDDAPPKSFDTKNPAGIPKHPITNQSHSLQRTHLQGHGTNNFFSVSHFFLSLNIHPH